VELVYKINFTVRDIRFTKIGIFLHSPDVLIFCSYAGANEKKRAGAFAPTLSPLSGGVLHPVGEVLDGDFKAHHHQVQVMISTFIRVVIISDSVPCPDE
jgi:hypothetical protein